MSMRIALLLSGLAAWPGVVCPATAQPAPIEVREDTVFSRDRGTLRVGDDGVAFDARDAKHSRHWTFAEVRQLRIASSRRIIVETYQSRGWRGLGHSQTHRVPHRRAGAAGVGGRCPVAHHPLRGHVRDSARRRPLRGSPST